MRHGQSKANAAKLIVGRLDTDASGDYGLTGLGREQALTAAVNSGLPDSTLTYSSPLSRARETAEIVREHLKAPEITIADSLRERDFGAWEGTSTANYEKVWADDEAGRTQHGVEPVAAVLDRTTALVVALEAEHKNKTVLLVAHGDILQILQAGFQGLSPQDHRAVEHLKTAEIRRVLYPSSRRQMEDDNDYQRPELG